MSERACPGNQTEHILLAALGWQKPTQDPQEALLGRAGEEPKDAGSSPEPEHAAPDCARALAFRAGSGGVGT